MTTSLRRMVLGAILLIAGAFVATGLAGSAALNADHTYHGCFQSNGNVYLTGETGLNTVCRNNDTAFAFNMQGQVGATGAQGPQGIQGPAGPQGVQGPPGPQGIQGPTGAPGANGHDGADGAPGHDGTDGTNGTNGTNGLSVVSTVLPSGDAHCATGGVQLSVGTSSTFVCNGERGPTGPQGPAGAGSSGDSAPDSYAGNYALSIDGTNVGGIDLIDGCSLASSVVTTHVNGVTQKHLGNPAYEACTFEFGANAGQALWDWFDATFSRSTTGTRHAVQFTRLANGQAISKISCLRALVNDLIVPAISPGSSSTFLLTGRVTPENCTTSSTSGTVPNTQVTPFSSGDVSISLGNVTGEASKIDGFTVSQTLAVNVVGGASTLEPSTIDVPNLTLHYQASDTASVSDLQDWFHSYVVQGNVSSSNEFPVTVSLANGARVLTFTGAGISRLDPEERASDHAYRADVFPGDLAITP